MGNTRGRTRRRNYDDDASNRKWFKTRDNGGAESWSDLDHDVLFRVMMKLGSCIDFFAFSEVCKSWRSLALCNKKKFITSKPPMLIWVTRDKNECYLEDFEGRRFKAPFPYYANRNCIGLTCGYLILFRRETRDFWLVNPITSHELYFPCAPYFDAGFVEEVARGILVFSPSISGWVFIMTYRLSDKIWFSIAGTGTEGGAWNHVSSTFPIFDLHAFKGKIYALNKNWSLCEMTLNPEPKLTLLDIKNCLKPCTSYPKIVSAGEKLYVVDHIPKDLTRVLELDFGKMKWVSPKEKTIGQYAFFLSILWNGTEVNGGAMVKLDPRARSQYKVYDCFTDSRKGRFFVTQNMWHFPHECMNVSLIYE